MKFSVRKIRTGFLIYYLELKEEKLQYIFILDKIINLHILCFHFMYMFIFQVFSSLDWAGQPNFLYINIDWLLGNVLYWMSPAKIQWKMIMKSALVSRLVNKRNTISISAQGDFVGVLISVWSECTKGKGKQGDKSPIIDMKKKCFIHGSF